MKGCLEEDRLLALTLAEPGYDVIGQAHLARCRKCAAAYRDLVADTKVIAHTLDATARAVMDMPGRTLHHVRDEQGYRAPRFRGILVTGSAAAFTAALAAALLLMLPGLRAKISPLIHQSSAMTVASNAAITTHGSVAAAASGDAITSAESPYMLWQPYQNEVIITDPSEDIGYHEALAGTSSYQDLFFCVPQGDEDDRTVCTSSAEQG
jgi:hypothetical protein